MALGSNMGGKKPVKKKAEAPKKEPKKTVRTSKAGKPSSVKTKRASQPKTANKAQVATTSATEENLVAFKSAQIEIIPSRRKKVKQTRVSITGNLTIDNTVLFQQKIEPLFDEYNIIDILIKDVTAIDVSFVQLLYFLKNSRSGDKTVTVDAELVGDLSKMMQTVGFEKLLVKPKLT